MMAGIQCSKCQFQNPEGFGFCGSCGEKLEQGCPSCGAQLISGFKFCGSCGQKIDDEFTSSSSTNGGSQSESSLLEPMQPAQILSDKPEFIPEEFANGRYRSTKFLGEGGKKKVYLAYDSLLDREVAFALIKTEGLDDQGRARITREAQAMGRLGSHGSIVTVFDLGEHNGQPFMVTELMAGGDVEGMVEDAENHRIPIDKVLRIGMQICNGLQFAHERGIIHRDLKPGNVWLTGDGDAKIGDFGLAVATDKSRLTQMGMMVGTVAYMPPEQAMGGEVTPKADLYSLGAMLYEMITGRPPFLADDPLGIISQHINTAPVAPTWHNGNCPKPLESLVLRLLGKGTAERPDSASDVLSALQGIELTSEPENAVVNVDESQNQALDAMAGNVFVGRQREMGELKAGLEDALSGRGRLMTLVGEPGIGKTRTSQELATYATLRGAQVLWGRCYDSQGVPPYWPWVQAIRSYVQERDTEDLRSVMGSGASDIAEIVGDVRSKLGDLEKPQDLDPEQARFRLFDSTTNFFRTSSRNQPIVLFLDDLHWADKPSLLLLEFMARELGGSRLLVVGTYRDVELSRQHPLAETLGELTRERLFQRVLLRGLVKEDIGRFIEVTTNVSPPDQLVESVYTQTEGNPLFVTEVVRLLVQEGELAPERINERDSWSVRIPEGVREVIGRRLNRLSDHCNQILTTASVIGREFELQQLLQLTEDVTQDRLLELIEEALASRVIEEMPQTVGRYQFTHALIQETLSEELSITRKVRLHGQVAQGLEELYGANVNQYASELAFHYAQAETVLGPQKLIHFASIAGQQSLEAFAFEEARDHFMSALHAKEGTNTTGKAVDDIHASLLSGVGEAFIGEGNNVQGWPALHRAFEFYKEIPNIEKCLEIAEIYCIPAVRGPHPVVAEAVEMAPSTSLIRGRLLSFHGRFLGFAGRYEEAIQSLEEAKGIAESFDNNSLLLAIMVNTSMASNFDLRWDESSENIIKAYELVRSSNFETDDFVLQAYGMSSGTSFWRGEMNKALEINNQMQEIVGRTRGRFAIDNVLGMRTNLFLHNGRFEEALVLNERLVESSPNNVGARGFRAHLQYLIGDFVKGSQYINEMIEVANNANIGPQAGLLNASNVVILTSKISGTNEYLPRAEGMINRAVSQTDVAPTYALVAKVLSALVGCMRGDVSLANKDLDELLGYSETIIRLAATTILADEVIGSIYDAMGEHEKSKVYFDLAYNHFSDDYKVLKMRIGLDYVDVLEKTKDSTDRIKASEILDEVQEIARTTDARPLLERALSKRDILKA